MQSMRLRMQLAARCSSVRHSATPLRSQALLWQHKRSVTCMSNLDKRECRDFGTTQPVNPQRANHAAALVAAVALSISPMGVPAAPVFAAGEPSGTVAASGQHPAVCRELHSQMMQQQCVNETGSVAQPCTDPGWGMPSPMPHPPPSPPLGPNQPSLPPGPPDLLPHKPPPPPPNSPQPQQPQVPQIPDVPPQLLPPCPPNPAPPKLLPPCPQPSVPPPLMPTAAGATGRDNSSTNSSSSKSTKGGSNTEQAGSRGVGLDGPSLVSVGTPLSDTALLAVGDGTTASSTTDAAFDDMLTPAAAGGGDDGVTGPQAVVQETTPRSNIDSDTMSINLDARPPPVNPTTKSAPPAPAVSGSSSRVSEGGLAVPFGSSSALSDVSPGSITLSQVLSVTGKLALQLLEVLVRVSAVVIKVTLQDFIWLVKLIGQWATTTS